MATRWCVILMALALSACGGDREAGETPAQGEAPTEGAAPTEEAAPTEGAAAEAEAAATTELELPNGLKVPVPEGTEVSELPVPNSYMVRGPGLVFTVEASTLEPESLDAAKAQVEQMLPNNTNVQGETLDDGWVMTHDSPSGTAFFAVVRRTIGETTVVCKTTTVSDEQRVAAVRACKALHN